MPYQYQGASGGTSGDAFNQGFASGMNPANSLIQKKKEDPMDAMKRRLQMTDSDSVQNNFQMPQIGDK